MPDQPIRSSTSPTDDVHYDEEALREGAERMRATGTRDSDNPDPEGDHDPKALRDAEKKTTGRRGASSQPREP